MLLFRRRKIAIMIYMQPIELTGPRVLLRDLTVDDIPLYYDWQSKANPELTSCRPITRRTLPELIDHMREHFEKRDVTFLAVRRRSDDALLGRITVFNLNERNRSLEIGYLIGPLYRQQGYAREALRLLLPYMFDVLQLNKVTAQTGAFNQASIALLESLGFKCEGRLRQHHWFEGVLYDDLLYSLLAEEYRPAT